MSPEEFQTVLTVIDQLRLQSSRQIANSNSLPELAQAKADALRWIRLFERVLWQKPDLSGV